MGLVMEKPKKVREAFYWFIKNYVEGERYLLRPDDLIV